MQPSRREPRARLTPVRVRPLPRIAGRALLRGDGKMKVICERASQCDNQECPHRKSHEPHDDCGLDLPCSEVTKARCVMDTAALPEYGCTGTVAIIIKRKAA